VITVFTSCWNQGEFLAEAIESVLNQTYQDFEYLIYDDGSTDGTKEIIERYKDPRIRTYYLEKQDNVGCVINHSFRSMEGNFWVWCPADDVLYPELLQVKLEASTVYTHEAVIYSDWEAVTLPHLSSDEFKEAMKTTCPIGMTGIWIPKNVLWTVGFFPEHLPCCEDFYWILKALKADIRFEHLQQKLYRKRKHGNRSTSRYSNIIPHVAKAIRAEFQ